MNPATPIVGPRPARLPRLLLPPFPKALALLPVAPGPEGAEESTATGRFHAFGLPRYEALDANPLEAWQAAWRMWARAVTPPSEAMCRALILSLREPGQRSDVLEVGCGPGALSMRMAGAWPDAKVQATDASRNMLAAGKLWGESAASPVTMAQWDVTDPQAFPLDVPAFDLIVSSVMIQFLSPDKVPDVVADLAARLKPGGTLAFVEMDATGMELAHPDTPLVRKVFATDAYTQKTVDPATLEDALRALGLTVLPARRFDWRDKHYGPYLRLFFRRLADAALANARIDGQEHRRFLDPLGALASGGQFSYRLPYRRTAAMKA